MDTNTDQLIRFMLPAARVRGCFIRGRHIKAKATQIHGLHGEAAMMFSELLLGAIVLLSMNKGGVRQVLQVDSTATTSPPMQRMLAEVRAGCVRGFVRLHDQYSNKIGDKIADKNNIAAWMGTPLMVSTVRDTGMGEPYVSTIESDGEYLADHLLHFLAQSVQTRADIIVHDDVAILLEAMPGCSDEHWFKAVGALAKINNDDLIAADEHRLARAFDALGMQIVGRDPYCWHCGCQPERMAQSLQKMPAKELEGLVDDEGYIGVSCQYCAQQHRVLI